MATWPMCLVGAGALQAAAAAVGLAPTAVHGLLHQLFLDACRRRARAWGLRVLLLVPEHPAVARYFHGLRCLSVPRRAEAYSVHVDPVWRAPPRCAGGRAAGPVRPPLRGELRPRVSALAGRDPLGCSSTFNRDESPLTARAAEERWRQDAVGPLFPWQPLRKGSRAGERSSGACSGQW